MFFADRTRAGRALARLLVKYSGRDDVLVLGLPRGGIPVANEIAAALGVPLDAFLVRKLGVPGSEELAMGAVASEGVRVLDDALIARLRIPSSAVEAATLAARAELERREEAYRPGMPRPFVAGRIVILVDDGLATGSSMRAAIDALRRLGPGRIVVAVPVAPASTAAEIAGLADEFVCVATPEPFYAVGQFYAHFDQTTDEEVRSLLQSAAQRQPAEAR